MNSNVSILATTSNKQPTFESTSNAPPETGEERKTLNCLPNETIWRHWMIEAGGLKVFGGIAERKRDGGKKKVAERNSSVATSTKPCRESLSAGRTIITGRRLRNPDWGKK